MIQITAASVVQPRRRQIMPALLDTGSDVTAIPRMLTSVLQLYPISHLQLEDVEAETTTVFTYVIRLTIGDLVIPRLEVVLTGLGFAVVGRDVLNRLYLLLNGPKQTFEVAPSPLILSAS